MRKLFAFAAVVALALVAAVAAFADGGGRGHGQSEDSFTLAVYGDAPYGTSNTDTKQFDATPAFIDLVNADPKVDFVVHVGDIHSGKQLCSQAYDQSIFDLWTEFADPLVYTPGDNEWADCHKSAEGGGDPIANLALVRSIFFPNAGQTLGTETRRVLSQAKYYDRRYPSDARYVENVMWEQEDVFFVTLNIPGGSNNDTDVWFGLPTATLAQSREVAERTGADLRWLDAAFARAREEGAKAVVIVEQADMWDLDGKAPLHLSEYDQFVTKIASLTAKFRKPVLLFNGDSHNYLSDNPLSTADPLHYLHPVPYDVRNFHRIVVHGSTAPLEYLRLRVDPEAHGTGPNAFGPFSWEQVITTLGS